MDTTPVWDLLSGISVGDIVAWIMVIGAIVGTIVATTIKLYKAFDKYRNLKEKNEQQEKIIEEHDKTLKQFHETLQSIKNELLDLRKEVSDVNLKQMRHAIIRDCEDAIEKQFVYAEELASIEEMYELYVEVYHGNGYVTSLVVKVRGLPIRVHE